MWISSAFDGGNIRVVDVAGATARLEICPDPGTAFLHWFSFRCVAEPGQTCTFHITNAGRSRTKAGWKDYRAVASFDHQTWSRMPTRFNGETLSFAVEAQHPVFEAAHFAPYPQERHARILAWCQTRGDVHVETLGTSVRGRPIDLIRVGPREGGRAIWITAGQHPGEPMGAWFTEGLLHRLLRQRDEAVAALRRAATLYIVPNANPDGSFEGRLRTNAAGADLNRSWQEPDTGRTPEVFAIRAAMLRSGVNCYLDVHGDETIPFCFVVPSDSVPSITPQKIALRRQFEAALRAATPDFQSEHGYPPEAPGSADLSIAANWISEHFRCLGMTLEQPFKDLGGRCETREGWSPQRSRRLGADALTALAAIVDQT